MREISKGNDMRRDTKKCGAAVVLCFGLIANYAHAAEDSYPAHEVAVATGVAWNDSKSANFAGIEYEYRKSAKWGFGGLYETTWRGFDLEIVAAQVNYYPTQDWRLFAGAGVERKLKVRKNKALARFGAGYLIPVGKVVITPLLYIDWVEDNSTVTYLGFSVGFHL